MTLFNHLDGEWCISGKRHTFEAIGQRRRAAVESMVSDGLIVKHSVLANVLLGGDGRHQLFCFLMPGILESSQVPVMKEALRHQALLADVAHEELKLPVAKGRCHGFALRSDIISHLESKWPDHAIVTVQNLQPITVNSLTKELNRIFLTEPQFQQGRSEREK